VSIGLFVEGPSDRKAIPILIRKLGYRARITPKELLQSELLLPDKMAVHIRELLRVRQDVELILICIDSERVDPTETERRSAPIQRRLDEMSRVSVRYAVVDHALEGWLAYDEEAVQSVLGPRSRVNIRGNPDNHPTPADILGRVFRENGRDFRKSRHDPQIAEHASPERIAARSPTFKRFAEMLGHPISS
jgi:hypothetical protein